MLKGLKSLSIVLVAHGSRDPDWKIPFQKLLKRLAIESPNDSVLLSFMEFEAPFFVDLLQSILDSDAKASILVVPLFFSSGGHVANDIRPVILRLSKQYPESKIVLGESLGARDGVIHAMAEEVRRDIADFTDSR